jgi:hypothetical protein
MRHLGNKRARTVRAATPKGNEDGQLTLEGRGWSPTFATPRMLRGKPIDWDPTLIWSILSFAFG